MLYFLRISSPPESGGVRGSLNRLMSLSDRYLSFYPSVPTTSLSYNFISITRFSII